MANVNQPSGLSPVGYSTGSTWNGQSRRYCIPSSDSNAYAIGDPVTLAGSADANGVPTITLATAGTANVIAGVIVGTGGIAYGGMSANPSNLDSLVIPATKTKAYYVDVADDPYIEFQIQDDAAGTNNGYVSGWQLAANSSNTGATRQVQILRLAQVPNNTIGQYAKWIVRIVNHQFAAGTAGV